MADAISIIAAACEDMREDGLFCHSPRVVKEADIDLTKFEKQSCVFDGCDFEFIDQSGPGISGDDFHGTMAWPIGDGLLFVLKYIC